MDDLVNTAVCAGEPVVDRREVAQDTTGAGDAFFAGLATALAENMGWPDSLRRAAACGAWVAQREGVLAALPGAADIRAMLAG